MRKLLVALAFVAIVVAFWGSIGSRSPAISATPVPTISPACGIAFYTPVPGAPINAAPMAAELNHLEACTLYIQLTSVFIIPSPNVAITSQPGIVSVDQVVVNSGVPTPNPTGPCCAPWPTGNYVLFNKAFNGATFWDEANVGDWKTSGQSILRIYQNNQGANTLPFNFQVGGGLGAYQQSDFVGTSFSLSDAGEPANPVPTCAPGGSLGSHTDFIEWAAVNENGISTAQIPELSVTCGANTLAQLPAPQPGAGMAEYNVYAASSSGAEVLQTTSGHNLNLSTIWTEPTTGVETGGATPEPCDQTGGAYTLHTGNGNTMWSFGNLRHSASPCPAMISVGNQSTQTANVTFNAAAGPTFNGLSSATNNVLCGANATPTTQCANLAMSSGGGLGLDGGNPPTNGLGCGVANTTACSISAAGGSTTQEAIVLKYGTACVSTGSNLFLVDVQATAELLVKCNGNTVATGTIQANGGSASTPNHGTFSCLLASGVNLACGSITVVAGNVCSVTSTDSTMAAGTIHEFALSLSGTTLTVKAYSSNTGDSSAVTGNVVCN